MPELPEVETVRKGLSRLVIGKTILAIDLLWPKIIEQTDKHQFQVQLSGETIRNVNRRGKYLIFQLDHYELISHLRMEGKYEFYQAHEPLAKHTHVIFKFTDATELRYLDVRKFGRMALVPKGKSENYPGIQKLGPEPVPTEFFLADFQEQLKSHHRSIKPLLLEQKLVTGLGNIYVDEALFLAGIHPETAADELTEKEEEKLYASIIEVLDKAVAAGGTTIRTYANALGEAGKFQVELKVYGQTNNPCPTCGTPIQKIKVAQRGTHFCPNCQLKHGKV